MGVEVKLHKVYQSFEMKKDEYSGQNLGNLSKHNT
jgi:hypothetical protein